MKIVLLTSNNPHQIALASKLHENIGLAGVVFSKNISKKKKSFLENAINLGVRVRSRVSGREFAEAWSNLRQYYSTSCLPKNIPKLSVENINDEDDLDLIELFITDINQEWIDNILKEEGFFNG